MSRSSLFAITLCSAIALCSGSTSDDPPPKKIRGCVAPFDDYMNCEPACFDFSGIWMNGTQSVNITQSQNVTQVRKQQYSFPARVSHDGVTLNGCIGSFADVTFKAATVPCATEGLRAIQNGDINGCGAINAALTASSGLTAKIVRAADSTTLAWSNGRNWTKPCADFSGMWCIHPVTAPECDRTLEQNSDGASLGGFPAGCVVQGFTKGYIKGNHIDTDYHGLKATIELADSKTPGLDRLIWQVPGKGDVTWYRYQNRSLPPVQPHA